MPEHDTHDLDAVFARLERDVSTLSIAPGAGAAVARARRRRRTAVGAVAAAAILAVGGIAVAQGVSHDESVAPADHLPTPAPLDGPHLTAATAGWTPEWTSPSEQARLKLQITFGGDCLANIPGGRGGIIVLGNAHDDLALAVMGDYRTDAAGEQHAWRRVERQMATCASAEEISSFSDPSGAEGHTYRIQPTESETAPQYAWIVNTGSAIGELKVLDQSDPLPTANDRPVADALLAAVQWPGSYDGGGAGDLSGAVTGSATVALSDADFTAALGGWQSGWSTTRGNPRDAGTAPCGISLSDGATSGAGQQLGANGEQGTYGFESPAGALATLQASADTLAACPTTAYDVRAVPLSDGSVTVAAGTGPDAGVVWLVRSGSTLAYITIPAGDTTPPDAVTQAVGELLLADLGTGRHGPVSTSSQSPGSGSSAAR